MRGFWLAMLCLASAGAIVLGFFLLRLRPVERVAAPAGTPAPGALAVPTVTFVNPARGRADARLTVAAFSDFTCAACARLAPVLEDLVAARPDVRVAWKDAPKDADPLSVPAAVAAHCADRQGKFWAYHDELFARQLSLTADTFAAVARATGLDEPAFAGCLDAQDTIAIVRADHAEAIGLGITATPTLFIGTRRIEGSPSLEELLRYVDEAR